MLNILIRFAVTVTLIGFASCQSITTAGATRKLNESMIVSTDWLTKHLNDDGLVLLQVGEKKEYDEAHIAGAQFIQLQNISTPRGQGLILELPSVDQLKATF
jgi:3-mercaptopyruvate sulfurtransferase SseA